MVDIDQVFIRSIENAVNMSMQQGMPLMVYISASEDGNQWISTLLTDGTLQVMKEKAVCLRLIQSTPQFQMFEQFFAKVVVPSVYCIRTSVIWDVLHGDLTHDGFDSRVKAVINGERHPDAQPTPVITSPTASQQATPQPQQAPQVPTSTSTPTPSRSPDNIVTKKEHKTLKEQSAELIAKSYKEEQLRKVRVAKEEKERIKRLLKADEEERRAQNKRITEEKERQRRLSNDKDEFDDEHCIDEIILENKSLRDNIHRRAPSSSSDICALSIRLLDGKSLKHNFLVTNTLNDVREWIDANRTDGDEPYCFHRTIPRTTFGITDEEKTLESLELTPRSALILKPFQKFTTAYTNTNQTTSGGMFSRLYNGISTFWGGQQQQDTNITTQQQPYGNDNANNNNNNTIEPFRDNAANDPTSASTSQFVSPLHSPTSYNNGCADLGLSHPSTLSLNFNPNELSFPQRPITPGSPNIESSNSRVNSPNPGLSRANSSQARFRTLNSSSAFDDRATYNGNQLNLEDDRNKN